MRLSWVGMTVLIMASVAVSQTQTPIAFPAFDVASVKQHELPPGTFTFRKPKAPGPPLLHATGNRFTENMATVRDLIIDAYGVNDYQISGLADWTTPPRGEHFDIDARAPGEGTPAQDQLRLMLQNLLADRFQLRLHREMRPLPVYALVIGKNGPKVREITKEEYDAQPRYSRTPERFPEIMASTMTAFSDSIARQVDRPVVDQTGLTGYYEIATPEWMQPNRDRSIDPMAAQSAVFSELESRIGLKLEPRKDPAEVLVIDHVERPSAN